MRKLGIIAVLSLLVVALAAVPALAVTNFDNAPNGAHFKGAARPTCSVNNNKVVCSSYKIAGVGNTNASASLEVKYTATVDCQNKGGKIVPVKATVQEAPTTTGDIAPEIGVLTVPSLTSGPVPDASEFTKNATCPNGNWTKHLRPGSPEISSFTYTLTFDGFTQPVIKITGP